MGLEIVRKNTDVKLVRMFVEFVANSSVIISVGIFFMMVTPILHLPRQIRHRVFFAGRYL